MKSIPQVKIAYIEQFPRVPTPFRLRNWANTARSYTEAAFRELATVETLKSPPPGYLGDIFTIPSYVGGRAQG